jgi:hypothetical protein
MQVEGEATAPKAADAAKRATQAFMGEVKCPRFTLVIKLMAVGAGLAFAYTFVLACGDEIIWAAWLRATQPVTDFVSAVVPAVRGVARDLVVRHFAARALYIAHVEAFQWLLFALFFLPAAALIAPECRRIKRGFTASAAIRRATSKGAVPWRSWVLWAFIVVMFLVLPFDGRSKSTGRYSYDLATGFGGLFGTFLTDLLWWCAAFYIWLRLLTFFAPFDDSDRGSSPARALD